MRMAEGFIVLLAKVEIQKDTLSWMMESLKEENDRNHQKFRM
jgi:fatty acid-binding protein DegV